MEYITTTDLRTQSSQLVAALAKGAKVSLIHRSKVVGIIQPPPPPAKKFDVKKFRELIKEPKSSKDLSYEEREKIYRQHLEKKYGKGLS